jgi:signal transduction histidine kinase
VQLAGDVSAVANQVERFVATRLAFLWAFQGLLAIPDDMSREQEFAFLNRIARDRLLAFQAIRVASTDRSIILDAVDGVQPAGLSDPRGQDPFTDPAVVRGLAVAGNSRRPVLASYLSRRSTTRDIALILPVIRADSIIGIVVGLIGQETLAVELTAQGRRDQTPTARRSLVIMGLAAEQSETDPAAPGDTILRIADPRRAALIRAREEVVELPTGDRWKVVVTHAATGWVARLALWGIGLAALWALALSSFREREQSRRIAERSEELEHLSTELLHANRAKSEFLANVSHELRTPLNAIVGFVDLLRDGVYGDLAPRQISPVDRIAASASHLRHLVDQVLDLAKITAGRLEVHTDLVDLRAFVLSVASEMESLITERGLSLSLAIGATLPRLRTDPTHLRQILVNLMGNAIKYTSAGAVSVRARLIGAPLDERAARATPDGAWTRVPPPPTEGVWIALQVADTGIGIAEGDRERIFDEFEQVGAGPRGDSMHRGTGLGLSISRRLARLLGGDIVVESELGKGSVFTLWLPVDGADLEIATERRAPGRNSGGRSLGDRPS